MVDSWNIMTAGYASNCGLGSGDGNVSRRGRGSECSS